MGKNLFANHTFDRELISKIYKVLMQLNNNNNNKPNNSIFKMSRRPEQAFFKEIYKRPTGT